MAATKCKWYIQETEFRDKVVLWRWLGFDRFFPPGKPDQEIKRGVASVSTTLTNVSQSPEY